MLSRIIKSTYHLILYAIFLALLLSLDLVLTTLNIVLPSRVPARGGSRYRSPIVPYSFSPSKPPLFSVMPVVHLLCRVAKAVGSERGAGPDWLKQWTTWQGIGSNGNWGAPIPPTPLDSRSPCPGLNALATNGILPPDGRDITFSQMAAAVSRAYNISPTLATQLTLPLLPLFAGRKAIDLEDVCAHGVIEHDGSLLRPDVFSAEHRRDPQALTHPHQALIDRLFPDITLRLDTPIREQLLPADFSKALTERRLECYKKSGQYYDGIFNKLVGSGGCALMFEVMGGDVARLREWSGSMDQAGSGISFSGEEPHGFERMPSGYWQPCSQGALGLTIVEAQLRMLQIELACGSTDSARIIRRNMRGHLVSTSSASTT
ncbi:Cloroperoxidase [Violaceomyces palustris]|uniref:Cloroperoxidase n=1 Tax=Violaceomyces palustris TaxID=1673888 RepID=A0ACD0NVU5_9BASI|nr:Cloroperoxidase [Violaceomyces palustris]